jgi:hypothetical protein
VVLFFALNSFILASECDNSPVLGMDSVRNTRNNVSSQKNANQRHREEKNMFGFLKRRISVKAAAPHREPMTSRTAVVRRNFDHLPPLPSAEVTEGNDEADWSLWEDSVAFQDSQMPTPYPQTRPAPLQAAAARDSGLSTAYDTLRGTDL